MFTPHMTDEELQAAAHKDFLEMRVKVKLAFEQFLSHLRLGKGQRRSIHSLIETKTISTKSKNTWNIVFVNTGYTPTDMFIAGLLIYIPLYRNGAVDYLFINNTEDFVLEKLSAHFLSRYKERYLEYKGINLRGMHPAVYYMLNNQDKTLTYYMPEKWTEQEMIEKSFMISKQGLSLVKFCDKLITYITFLDQENLSRYKAMIYEEEAFMKDVERLNNKRLTFDNKQALYKKICADPFKTKAILLRYILRVCDNMSQEEIDILMKCWDDIIKQTQHISDILEKQAIEVRPLKMPDMEYFLKQMKKEK